ncbi:unnamed protein product [Closterium sp. Naga37s-1]|nr:unnamed protein product [Closterium sp. Naga37s-1]
MHPPVAPQHGSSHPQQHAQQYSQAAQQHYVKICELRPAPGNVVNTVFILLEKCKPACARLIARRPQLPLRVKNLPPLSRVLLSPVLTAFQYPAFVPLVPSSLQAWSNLLLCPHSRPTRAMDSSLPHAMHAVCCVPCVPIRHGTCRSCHACHATGPAVRVSEAGAVVCTALVADGTAAVHMQLWGAEVDALQPGDIVRLTSGIFSFHKSNLVLRAGKKGALEKIGEFTMLFVEAPNMSRLQWAPDPANPKHWVCHCTPCPSSHAATCMASWVALHAHSRALRMLLAALPWARHGRL